MADTTSWWWPFKRARPGPATPSDGAHDPALRKHFTLMLDYTEPPLHFRPSDVAKLLSEPELHNLGYERWQDAIPAIRVLAWDLREFGDCVIFYKDGKKVPNSVDWMDVEGPVRFQRRGKIYSDEYDWDDDGL